MEFDRDGAGLPTETAAAESTPDEPADDARSSRPDAWTSFHATGRRPTGIAHQDHPVRDGAGRPDQIVYSAGQHAESVRYEFLHRTRADRPHCVGKVLARTGEWAESLYPRDWGLQSAPRHDRGGRTASAVRVSRHSVQDLLSGILWRRRQRAQRPGGGKSHRRSVRHPDDRSATLSDLPFRPPGRGGVGEGSGEMHVLLRHHLPPEYLQSHGGVFQAAPTGAGKRPAGSAAPAANQNTV